MMADLDRDQSTSMLDYQTPIKPAKRPPSLAFWTSYTIAYVPGLVVLSIVTDMIDMYTRGHHSDGGIFFLGIYAFPIFAILLGIVRKVSHIEAAFATIYGLFAPTLTLLLLISIAYVMRVLL